MENEKIETLLQSILSILPEMDAKSWTMAVLQETCETAVKYNPTTPMEDLKVAAMISATVNFSLFNSLIEAGRQATNGGILTINYRGQTFTF